MIDIKEADYHVALATSATDISEISSIDDLAFAGNRGMNEKLLRRVEENGALLILCHTPTGYIVGEAQFLFSAIPDMPYTFAHPVGYCYGVAIRPTFQKHGLGKVLMQGVWEVALSKGLSEVRLSVRVENYPSLKLMFGQGFHVIEYYKDFHSPNKARSPRLIMSKSVAKRKYEESNVFIPVTFFDSSAEGTAHKKIAGLLQAGYIGVDVNREGIFFAHLL